MKIRLALVMLLVAASACRPSPSETQRLEAKAGRALAEGHPHLAGVLARKASHDGTMSAGGNLVAARSAALERDRGAAMHWLETAADQGLTDVGTLEQPAELFELRSDPAFDGVRRRVVQNARGEKRPIGTELAVSTPEREGIDPQALRALVDRAAATKSDGLVVLRHGKLVGQWYFGGASQRIEAMSATKSVVSLAIGMLLGDGKIKSLDQSVSDFFPEWKDTAKAKITVRHLLAHTSSLHANPTTADIYASRDFVRNALDAPLDGEPGAKFFYNNKAANLLAGLVAEAAGEPIDVYVQRRLFGPLGITDVTWSQDATGHRHGMSGLQIHPVDFAKIGQLMLDGGIWKGQRVLDPDWIALSTGKAGQPYDAHHGLLWWLQPTRDVMTWDESAMQRLRDAGVREQIVQKLEPLRGRTLSVGDLRRELKAYLKPFELDQVVRGGERLFEKSIRAELPYVGYSARGYLGQYLVIFPSEQTVAVRMREGKDGTSFEDFFTRVQALTTQPAGSVSP